MQSKHNHSCVSDEETKTQKDQLAQETQLTKANAMAETQEWVLSIPFSQHKPVWSCVGPWYL